MQYFSESFNLAVVVPQSSVVCALTCVEWSSYRILSSSFFYFLFLPLFNSEGYGQGLDSNINLLQYDAVSFPSLDYMVTASKVKQKVSEIAYFPSGYYVLVN